MIPLYSVGNYAEQEVSVEAGGTYTLSAYFAGGAGGRVEAYYKASNTYYLIEASEDVEPIGTYTDWEPRNVL